MLSVTERATVSHRSGKQGLFLKFNRAANALVVSRDGAASGVISATSRQVCVWKFNPFAGDSRASRNRQATLREHNYVDYTSDALAASSATFAATD